MNAKNSQKVNQQLNEYSTQPQTSNLISKSVTFSGLLTGHSTPSTIFNPQQIQNQAYQSLQGQEIQRRQINLNKQKNVFPYETIQSEKGPSLPVSISSGTDIQPQFSLHSPQRYQDLRKENKSGVYLSQQAIKSGQGTIGSAVRGRRIEGNDVDVVCTIASSDSQRMKLLNQGYNDVNFLYNSSEMNNPNIVNINTQSQPLLFHSTINLRGSNKIEGKSNQGSLRRRKDSTESKKGSQRANSQGKSDKKKPASHSQQNSQSASRNQKKDPLENSQSNRMLFANKQKSNLTNKSLKRPNSAANLKQEQSNNFNTRTMVSSPTVAYLSRESSQQYLPPKPKGSLRNYAKFPEGMYQSIGQFPLSNYQTSHNSNSNSIQKRIPSASSDRNKQSINQKPLKNIDEASSNTFSPLRKKQQELFQTNPPSNQKLRNSNAKSKSRQRHSQQTSSLKRKNNKNDIQNNQFSPNIQRIKAEKVIKEENKEEEETKRSQLLELKHSKEISFDESVIPQALETQQNNLNDEHQTQQQMNLQSKQLFSTKDKYAQLFKSAKQQLSTLNQDDKKKKKMKEKKEKIIKENEQQNKLKFNELKDKMQQKLEGLNKNQLLKRKKQKQQVIESKENEQLLRKKLEKKEQYEKEKEERQECLEMIKDTIKIPHMQSQSNSQSRKRGESSKSHTRPFSAKILSDRDEQKFQQPVIIIPHIQQQNDVAYDLQLLRSSIDSYEQILPLQEQMIDQNNLNNDINDKNIDTYIKKQKRERSKKRKNEEIKEQYKEFKKEKALQILSKQYKMMHEQYKIKFIQQIKGKSKNRKNRNKNVQQVNEQFQSQQTTIKKGQRRSRSKKRLDDEKENIRQSLSPTLGRSKSDKKKKRAANLLSQDIIKEPPLALLQKMQFNVLELMKQQDFSKKIFSKVQKSQTQKDLLMNLNQENTSLQKMNTIQIQGNSSLDEDLSYNNDQTSFNQLNQMFFDKSQHLIKDNKNKNIEILESQTPVILQKNKQKQRFSTTSNSQVIQGRPSESIKSFDFVASTITPNRIKDQQQKTEQIQDWMKKTQSKLDVIAQQQELNLAEQRNLQNQQEMLISFTQQNNNQNFDAGIVSPIRSPKGQVKHEKSVEKVKSNKKSKKGLIVRKGSAGQKRNADSQNLLVNAQTKVKEQMNKQKSENINRPKSANVQKLQMIDLIQQQKKIVQENKTNQKREQASILVQKFLKGYLARNQIKMKLQSEKNFQMINTKYFKPIITQSSFPSNQLVSPIKQLAKDMKIQEVDLDFKQEGSLQNKQTIKNQTDLSSSLVSKSQASLKALLQQEEVNKKKRPNSSETNTNVRKIQIQSKIPITNYNENYQNSEENKIAQISQKVAQRIEYQTQLNMNFEIDNKLVKGQAQIESISSVQVSNRPEDSKSGKQDQEQKKIKENQQNFLQLKGQQFKQNGNYLLNNFENDADSIKSFSKEQIAETKQQEDKAKSKSKLDSDNKVLSQKKKYEISSQISGKKDQTYKFFEKLQNANNHNNQAHSLLLQSSINNNNLIMQTSEDKDQSWQFDRKSFQEFFDEKSQIQNKESHKIIPNSEMLGGGNQKQKKNLTRKLNQFEQMIEVLSQEKEQKQKELDKLLSKKTLSPRSNKKKIDLEKWVAGRDEEINSKRKYYQENVNEMITKIERELQQTKKKIGTKKNKGPSNVFNISVEWSHNDMSIGHLTANNSSIHSTPRIVKPQDLNLLQSQLLSSNAELNKNKKQPFEYKVNEVENVFKNNTAEKAQSSEIIIKEKEQESIEERSGKNIFSYNLQEEHQQEDSDAIQVEDMSEDNQYEKFIEQVSLSKLYPPNFQSPTLSAISPNQNFKDYFNEEEEKQNAFQIDQFDQISGTKELLISQLSPEQQSLLQSNVKDDSEPINQKDLIKSNLNEQFKQQNNNQLVDAFLALKEPEQPITHQQAVILREEKEIKDQQADTLTDYILSSLIDQLQGNLFPKRPIIGMKSPSKLNEIMHDEIIEENKEKVKTDQDNQMINDPQISKEQEQLIVVKKKKLRGIKTSMRIVDSYIADVLEQIKEQENQFIENLSTPLNKDPLEILFHQQNVFVDDELENAVAFQQSVLPVDLYLDIEKNKQKVQIIDTVIDEDEELEEPNKSMLQEWENIHNKVIFDAINEALDNFRPYGLKGPPMPWSQQTRTLTYKNGQQIDLVLKQVRQKVMEWARTFSGALPSSELLLEYGIKGPLDEDKLNLLREERLALVLAAEIEENEMLWTDYEYEETQSKLDIADMILEVLADETVREINKIRESRDQQ